VPRDKNPLPTLAPILAVVVCYHPDVRLLARMAETLVALPGLEVLFIDNTELETSCPAIRSAVAHLPVRVLCPGTNSGLGAAHNMGIREARARGCKAVLLLDQDSLLDLGSLRALCRAYDYLTARGEQVAAVGPTFIDPRNGHCFPFVRLHGFRMRPVSEGPGNTVECDLLISSGSLIPLAAVDDVGEMDPSLFIDYVDIEWCIRAAGRGWKVFGITDALMSHTLGDETLAVFGHKVPVHAPERQYYLLRNAVLLARMPHVPWRWRIHLAYRVAAQIALFGLFCAPRLQRAGWMLRGIWDALWTRRGRLHGPANVSARGPRTVSIPDGARTVELPR
jgi:rhamnosyltransferase